MSENEFIYWLKGFFELTDPETLTKEQVKLIKFKLEEAVIDKKSVGQYLSRAQIYSGGTYYGT